MEYTLTISQKAIHENFPELDIKDAAIIDFLSRFVHGANVKKRISGQDIYYWFDYGKIVSENPLLKLGEEAIRKRMRVMCGYGIFKAHEDNRGGPVFFAFGDQFQWTHRHKVRDENPIVHADENAKGRENGTEGSGRKSRSTNVPRENGTDISNIPFNQINQNQINQTVAPSSLLVTMVEIVEVEADEKSAVEEKKEVTNRSVAPLPPTPLPAEPTQPAAKPKRKGKNSSEPFTYRDMAKYMEIPVQVFFSEIIRNEAWPKWIEYKKNKKKFEYDAADSAAAVVRKLHSISGGDPSKAAEIILQSRSSGWAGLFPLESQQQQRQPYQNQQQPRQRSEVDGLVFSR